MKDKFSFSVSNVNKTIAEIRERHTSEINLTDYEGDFWQDLNHFVKIKEVNKDSNAIKITVLGEPTSQKRHRSVRVGKFTRQYDPSAADKADFLSLVHSKAPDKPFDCPLMLEVIFYFTHPKSHYKTGKKSSVLKDIVPLYHTGRPDVDNLTKFIMDSLNKIYWRDDSIIADCSIKKFYSENPRTEILISTL